MLPAGLTSLRDSEIQSSGPCDNHAETVTEVVTARTSVDLLQIHGLQDSHINYCPVGLLNKEMDFYL